jgi:hypothetical protein
MEAFITKGDFEAYLGYEVESDKATLSMDAACGLIRGATNQDFEAGEGTVKLDGSGTDELILPHVPVEAVTSIASTEAFASEATAVTDYLVTSSGIVLRKPPAIWPTGRGNVEVTFTYGYSDVPAEIRMLALTVAARCYVQGIVTVAQVGTTNTTFATDALSFTPGEQNIVARYRYGTKWQSTRH